MVNWGILGSGRIANDFVLALKDVDDAKVVAVGASSLEKAQDFAKKHSVEKSYGSYKELVEDADVTVIYIATTHNFHKEHGILALSNGKHVLVEKPMCPNAKESEELINFAKSKNLFLMEGVWSRFFPAVIKAQEMAAMIGEIKFVDVTFGFENDGTFPRLLDPNLAGGSLLDVGIYCVSFISMFFGGIEPKSVKSVGHLTETGVDDMVSGVFDYGDGKHACFSASISVQLPCECKIVGQFASCTIPIPFHCPTELKSDFENFEFPLPYKNSKPSDPWEFTNSNGFQYEAEHVQKMLQENKTESDVMSLAESLQIAKTCDQIRAQIGVVFPFDK